MIWHHLDHLELAGTIGQIQNLQIAGTNSAIQLYSTLLFTIFADTYVPMSLHTAMHQME